jgi:hypothetical protein
LSGSEVAGCWVSRSRYGLSTRRMHGPSGVPSSARVQRRDSLNNPLLGFSSPTRPISSSPPPTSLPAAPLLGFQFPSTHQEERVHVRTACLAALVPASPVLPGLSANGSHPASYGVAHRFSQPRSDFFLSPPSRHFQTGGVRGIHPTGGCSSYEASTARRRRNTLVTFFLRTALPPS